MSELHAAIVRAVRTARVHALAAARDDPEQDAAAATADAALTQALEAAHDMTVRTSVMTMALADLRHLPETS